MKTMFLTEDEDVTAIECTWAYIPSHKGARDSLCGVRGAGPPLEPDTPAELVLKSAVEVASRKQVELSDDDLERATQEAWDEWERMRNEDTDPE